MPCNILGYALIELPELLVVIYRFLRKLVINRNMSILNVSTVPVQNNIELTSVSSLDAGGDINHGEEATNISSFKEVTTNRLDKLEESVGKLIQKIDEISQKLQYRN